MLLTCGIKKIAYPGSILPKTSLRVFQDLLHVIFTLSASTVVLPLIFYEVGYQTRTNAFDHFSKY